MRKYALLDRPAYRLWRYGAFCLVLAAVFLNSCGHVPRIGPEDPHWVDDDRRDIPEPEKRDPNLAWSAIDRSFFDQGEQALDLTRNVRKLTGRSKQAPNINSFDEAPNSSWFTNRHGLNPMTPEEIACGPVRTLGPDTSGPWMVFRPKVQGATPGFWIEDSRGDQYIIKFDPAGFPELATAAAAMGSRYFHACGYNVPQETIVHWRPEIAQVKEGVTFTDRKGVRRSFAQEDLEEILASIHHEPDGRIRSLASLSIGKKVKGGFSYSGRREDDPNDWCPHEHRRELRGLYVLASLVNHYDTKEQNTLDIYEEENGRRFLKHYLIDFGSTFGSDGDEPKPPEKGYANMYDLRDGFVSLVTLGLKTWGWEGAKPFRYPSIGYFESEIFKPDKFDPIVPNPAFENMTDRDGYWGAKIVMAFRDEHLAALAKAGQFSNPEAEAYLLRTLIERRDKIGRHWFGKVNPLDYFEAKYKDSALNFSFDDLAVKYGLEPGEATYRLRVCYKGKDVVEMRELTSAGFSLSADDLNRMRMSYIPNSSKDRSEDHLHEIRLRTKRNKGGWSKPAVLWLRYTPERERYHLVGVEHPN